MDTRPFPECNKPCASRTEWRILVSRAYYSASERRMDAMRELLVPNPTSPSAMIAFMAKMVSCC